MTEEVTGTAPAPADVVTTTPAEQAPAQPAEPKAEAAQAPVEPKKVDHRQRKIAELSYELRESRRQMDRLMGIVEKTATQSRPTEPTEPKAENYSNLDEYIEAKMEYREKMKAMAETPKAGQREEHAADYSAARDSLAEAGSEKYEDFDEVVFSDDVKISPVMAQAIFGIDEPGVQADVAYYLAKNPKDAARISRLPQVSQIKEIGKLEMKLSSEPEKPKKPSTAPKPIEPVGGANTNSDEIKPEMSYKDFLKVRNKQLGR